MSCQVTAWLLYGGILFPSAIGAVVDGVLTTRPSYPDKPGAGSLGVSRAVRMLVSSSAITKVLNDGGLAEPVGRKPRLERAHGLSEGKPRTQPHRLESAQRGHRR